MRTNMKHVVTPRGNIQKVNAIAYPPQNIPAGRSAKPMATRAPAPSSMQYEVNKLSEAAASIQQIRMKAQHELNMAKRMRADAQKYQRETETQARSQAQQLILHTRLTTQKEIEELIQKASAEIQKVLADIRIIRITAQEELETQRKYASAARLTAQEELAAQRKYTNAAKLKTLTLEIQEKNEEPTTKGKKQLAAKK